MKVTKLCIISVKVSRDDTVGSKSTQARKVGIMTDKVHPTSIAKQQGNSM